MGMNMICLRNWEELCSRKTERKGEQIIGAELDWWCGTGYTGSRCLGWVFWIHSNIGENHQRGLTSSLCDVIGLGCFVNRLKAEEWMNAMRNSGVLLWWFRWEIMVTWECGQTEMVRSGILQLYLGGKNQDLLDELDLEMSEKKEFLLPYRSNCFLPIKTQFKYLHSY